MQFIHHRCACQLNKDYATAIKALDAYQGTWAAEIEERRPNRAEKMEFFLYRAYLEEISGNVEGALKYLQLNEKEISDKNTYFSKCGEIYLKLGKFNEAESIFRKLLKRNPECYEYHSGLQVCYYYYVCKQCTSSPQMSCHGSPNIKILLVQAL